MNIGSADKCNDGRCNILYVVPPSATFAGIERVTHDLSTGIDPSKINVTVLYMADYPEVVDPPYNYVRISCAKVRSIPRVVNTVVSRGAFDAVVVPQYEIAFLCLMFNRMVGKRTRFVLHLHGNPEIERGLSLKSRFLFAFFAPSARMFAGIIAVSPSLAQRTEELIKAQRTVTFLPNPIRQLQVPIDRDGGLDNPDGPVIVSVGRLAFQKGHDLTILAFSQVVKAFPSAQLVILGEGPERSALQALVEECGLTKNVRLCGHVSQPAMHFKDATIFVSASRWEGFGVAIVEALSAGLYVVATRCEFGPEDIIIDKRIGLLADIGDYSLLSEAIIEAINCDARSNEVDFRRRYAKRYELSVVARQHTRYLMDLCGISK